MRRRSEASQPRASVRARDVTLRLPHDVVNEQVIIAAMLVDLTTCDAMLRKFPPDFYYGKGHAEIVTALGEMRRRGLTYDPATLVQLSGGRIESAYLDQLTTARPKLPPNLHHHVDALAWDRTRIEAATGPVEDFLEALRDPTTTPEQMRTVAKRLGGSFDGGTLKYLRDPDDVVREMMGTIDKRRAGAACYPYGLPGLDRYETDHPTKPGQARLTPGMAPGQVTVITGLSGGGKTTATAAIILEQARARRRTLYGAWEQGAALTLELIALQSLGLSRAAFIDGAITSDERDAVEEEARLLSQWIRFVEIPFGRERGKRQFNDQNLDLIHNYIADTGADIFVADLWRRALRQMDPDEEEQALYRQQAIAVETKCHVMLVHQQRLKDVEQREDKQPTREGLKGSGAWIEVADTIIGVHRPALFKAVPDDKLLMLILKQRHGMWPLAIEFDWNPEYGSIRNGHSVDYQHPGQASDVDSFLAETSRAPRVGGKRRR